MPIIIGGVEASLRRFAHYDCWDDRVRASVLVDSGADILLYGMGEKSIVELADALNAGMEAKDITYIDGTVFRMKELDESLPTIVLPSYEDLKADKRKYAESFKIQYGNCDPFTAKRLAEAARGALEKGYRLKIYDAFRPQVATQEIYELTNSILDTPIPELPFTDKKTIEELNLPVPKKQIDPVTGLEVDIPLTYREVMIVPPYTLDYFVAEGTSKHNYGIALDLTIEKLSNGEELEMQTSIHDLSHYSARDKNNKTANTLSSIMKKAGFTTLVSEWWHFNDLDSKKNFPIKPLKKGVSAKCWMVDDTGVRGKITNWLTDEEVAKLQASANKLKSVIAQIEI